MSEENKNSVSVHINGRIFSRWSSCSIAREQTALASSFTLETPWWLPDEGEALLSRPGDLCTIAIDDEPVISGYIDRVGPSADPDRVAVQISGRSRAGDLVDCSAMIAGGQMRNLSLLDACRRLCDPFGIAVSVAAGIDPGGRIALIEIEQSETVVSVIQRLCRDHRLLCWSDAGGNLVLGRGSRGRAEGRLIHRIGPNGEPSPDNTVLSITGEFDAAARFSEVHVRGQAQSMIGLSAKAAASPHGIAHDDAIRRYRPKIVGADGAGNGQHMIDRAEWEVSRRIAEGTKITARMASWRQGTDGPLWDIGYQVPVISSLLNLEDDLMVSGVTFSQDATMMQTDLTLEPQQAQEPIARQAKGSGGGQWDNVRKQTGG